MHGRTGVAFIGLLASLSPVPRDFYRYGGGILIAMLPAHLRDELELLAARDALGITNTSELVSIANRFLCNHVFDDELLRIIDATPPVRSEIFPHFKSFCERHGIATSDKESAIWVLLRCYMTRMSDAKNIAMDEFEAFQREIAGRYDFVEHKNQMNGDSHGISQLFHLDMQYGWYISDPKLETEKRQDALDCLDLIQSQMRDVALDWLANHPTPKVETIPP